jgi:cellulose synthase/poly-beta-1,6-N-acetylglucosamine synthase-like glycosyltransferase
MGKPNACHAGSRNATTDYLLFTDADTRYAPEFAPSIVRFAEQNQCVLVSAFLRQRLSTPFEHILLPYAQGLYFCGVNARRIHDVAFQDVLVNGQCMLFQRTAYEFLGGHMVVNNCVIEDMVLAAKLKRHQMKMILLRAEHLGSVRMYGSFSAISRAFQKNSFRFLMMNKRAGFQVLAASVLLAAYLPLAAWLAWEDQWFVLIMHALLPLYLMAPWYGGVVKAVLSIAAMYLFPLLSLHAVLRSTFSRKTLWKGRPV